MSLEMTQTKKMKGSLKWKKKGKTLGRSLWSAGTISSNYLKSNFQRRAKCTCSNLAQNYLKMNPQHSTSTSTNRGSYSNLFSLMIFFLHMVCRCMLITQQWLDSLRGSGSCSLLRGLEKAIALTDIDTLLIVMGSRY